MPERYEIRGQDLPDGNKALSPKDVYNVNKNFETIGLELFGNINFTGKLEKKVKGVEDKVSLVETDLGDAKTSITQQGEAIILKADKATTDGLDTRLDEAELKITPTAITSTVRSSTQYIADLNTKANTSTLTNYSTITQTATAITSAVSSKADSSALENYSLKTQTATEISEKVASIQVGGRNLIPNSGFEDGWQGWWNNTPETVTLEGSANTMFEGKNMLIIRPANNSSGGKYFDMTGLRIGQQYVFSIWGNPTGEWWIGANEVIADIPNTQTWGRHSVIFTATATSHLLYIIAYDSGVKAAMYIDNVQLEEGNKITPWKLAQEDKVNKTEFIQTTTDFDLKINNTTHNFNAEGYTLKDSTGASLMTPNGMANEQNFGSTQNVQDGYPLRMSFKIGDATSIISSVTLRLKQYNFRTDSAGAASGGGSTSGASSSSTSGASSKTSTDERWTGQGLTGVTVSQTNGVVGDTHNHAIGLNQFGHNHGMAHTHGMNHTHSTPAHSHDIVYGIREWINDNGTIYIFIDDVYVTMITNTDIVVDVTPWVTTNGTHNIGLVSPNLKRIQCDVFIKSYIRR